MALCVLLILIEINFFIFCQFLALLLLVFLVFLFVYLLNFLFHLDAFLPRVILNIHWLLVGLEVDLDRCENIRFGHLLKLPPNSLELALFGLNFYCHLFVFDQIVQVAYSIYLCKDVVGISGEGHNQHF